MRPRNELRTGEFERLETSGYFNRLRIGTPLERHKPFVHTKVGPLPTCRQGKDRTQDPSLGTVALHNEGIFIIKPSDTCKDLPEPQPDASVALQDIAAILKQPYSCPIRRSQFYQAIRPGPDFLSTRDYLPHLKGLLRRAARRIGTPYRTPDLVDFRGERQLGAHLSAPEPRARQQ